LRLSVSHTTRYVFSDPVAYGMQRLRLKPKPTRGQAVLDWKMELDGALSELEYDDHHQNAVTLVTVLAGVRELTVRCGGEVETVDNAGIVGAHAGHMPLWYFLRQTALTEPGPRLTSLVRRLAGANWPGGADEPDGKRADTLEILHALSAAVLEAVAYEPGTTDARTSAEAALVAGKGVCQDHAHVFIGAGRLLGIPTRYVSGYLKLDGSNAQEAGHGWAEAHVAGLGWVGFDVSNAICPDERYVRVATGRDYTEAAPVTGLAQGMGETSLEVAVLVEQCQSVQAQQQGIGITRQGQNFSE
jgi:transglutaminase-like putative cysteine protease